MKAHAKNNFALALKELRTAYALDAEPDLLYAIGQVYVKLDNCVDAIRTYQEFLDTKPEPQATADTEQAITSCKAKLETPPPQEPVVAPPEPPPEPPPPEPPPPPAPPAPAPPVTATPEPPPPSPALPPPVEVSAGTRRSPWYRDKVGDALVIGGVAAGVVGLVMYTGASSALDDAEASGNIDRYRQLVDDASTKRTYAVVLFAGGGALVAAGVTHYVLHRRGKHEARLGMVPTRGGGLVTWSGGL